MIRLYSLSGATQSVTQLLVVVMIASTIIILASVLAKRKHEKSNAVGKTNCYQLSERRSFGHVVLSIDPVVA